MNNIPAKVCSYACVYCQVGRTTRMLIEPGDFRRPEEVSRDVRRRLEEARSRSDCVDYLTVVPDGEPTLDRNLEKEIVLLKETGLPVAVITNGSLLWKETVRERLAQADWVSLKVDAVDRTVWRRTNRPHTALELSTVLSGMRAFASSFGGTLVTETMLIRGVNDTGDCLRETADFIHSLHPARAYLSIPTRPPAEKWVQSPTDPVLAHAYELFARVIDRVEYLTGYEGDAFSATGDVERDLIAIASVHPMRVAAVRALLSRTGSSWGVVDCLIDRGDLISVTYADHLYYVRPIGRTRRNGT